MVQQNICLYQYNNPADTLVTVIKRYDSSIVVLRLRMLIMTIYYS